MNPADIVPFDWQRLLIGEMTPWFMAEIVLRTVLIFAWLLLMIRWIGKRGVGQFSILELTIVVALGSAAGDPMFYAEVPLIHAMLVISLVVIIQRLVSSWIIKNESVETFLEGRPIELIVDGRLNRQGLQQARLSLEDVFENLRVAQIRQLGEVERAYLEQNGQMSVIPFFPEHRRHGLPIVPPWDLQCPPSIGVDQASLDQPLACFDCGFVIEHAVPACLSCGGKTWTWAVKNPLASPPL